METFVVTYAVVWTVLILYVIQLGMTQRRLTRMASQFLRSTRKNSGN